MNTTWRTWLTQAQARTALRARYVAKVAIAHALAMMTHPHTYATYALAPTLDSMATQASRVREARRVRQARQARFARSVWSRYYARKASAVAMVSRAPHGAWIAPGSQYAGTTMSRLGWVAREATRRAISLHVRQSNPGIMAEADAREARKAEAGSARGHVTGRATWYQGQAREARVSQRGASGIKRDRVTPGTRVSQADHYKPWRTDLPLTTVGVATHPEADASDYGVALHYVRQNPSEATVRVTYADGTSVIKPVADYTAEADAREAEARKARKARREAEAQHIIRATRAMPIMASEARFGNHTELASGAA